MYLIHRKYFVSSTNIIIFKACIMRSLLIAWRMIQESPLVSKTTLEVLINTTRWEKCYINAEKKWKWSLLEDMFFPQSAVFYHWILNTSYKLT